MDSPPYSHPPLGRSLALGSLGFTAVSLAGFSVWAFAGRWFYATVGEAGLYAATALVFLGLSGALLAPLLGGPRRIPRFYGLFIPAFVLYSVVWCGCWFALGGGWGEWLGSLLGSAVFAAWICFRQTSWTAFPRSSVVLFVTHSAGYFLGGIAMAWMLRSGVAESLGLSRSLGSTVAKLAWGLCYGLGFGLGLGFLFHAVQRGPVASGDPAAQVRT